MSEKRVAITGYEGIYEISESGRIFAIDTGRVKVRCGDEYGYHIVKLVKAGEPKNYSLYKLWKKEFPELEDISFKGALKNKYGTGCELLDKEGVHFT
ncbi:NUMOD4 domain-containing protein [Bacillus sp. SM2101]|uniref:NUMOD4 domain-containing protein n=1 Tax=Bacillus sp. SM2101 TaxID=2805366 RepID=UPI001BDDE1D8|nr:NUMOD4 domain-containing protein [Bacillus sp. SM2101]